MRPCIMFFLAAVSQAAAVPHDVPLVSIAPEGKAAVLSAGRLWGRLLDNRANHERQGSGFNPLVHLDRPQQPLFGLDGTGLNFEHIFNGGFFPAKAPKKRMLNPLGD